MTHKASHWFQMYKHSLGNHTWGHFGLVISWEFEVNTHRAKIMELLNVKQIVSMEEYKNQFDKLVYHILLYDSSIVSLYL
jgi:hypothetical protein